MLTIYCFMLNCVNFCLAAIIKLNDVIFYACVIIFYMLINFDLILTLKMT